MAKLKFGTRERRIVSTAAVILALTGAVVCLTLGLGTQQQQDQGSPADGKRFIRDTSGQRAFISEYRTYRSAAVTTDTNICSEIGIDILKKNGSAVDAAIASLLCVGVVNPQSTGIGGGHLATIYDTPRNGNRKILTTLMARERAPLLSTRDMFVNNSVASSKGGRSIAVPGEVKGLYEAWNIFGRLPWADLVQPTIDLCENGFRVEKELSKRISEYNDTIRNDTNLAELFVKDDGSLITEGDLLINVKLGNTFKRIAEDPMAFYNGSLAQHIVDDIKEYGGIVSLEDLAAYSSAFKEPLKVVLSNGDYTLYNPPPPSSGAVMSFIIGVLDGYNFKPSDIRDQQTLSYHRIIEAFKFASAKRSELGDEDFVDVTELIGNLTSSEYASEIRQKIDDDVTHDVMYYEPTFEYVPDQGTIHLNVIAADGSAVALSGTINLYFGSTVRGSRTGIIFNDEMDDFSTPGTKSSFGVPASPSNYIEPGKMPMSSMCPTLVFDANDEVVFLSGAAGGTRITTATAFVLANSLWFNRTLNEATDTPRVHHQLVPNYFSYEPNIDQDVLNGLLAKNHSSQTINSAGVCNSIRIRNPCDLPDGACIEAVSDGRKGGKPDGY